MIQGLSPIMWVLLNPLPANVDHPCGQQFVFELGVLCRFVHQQPNFCSCLGTFEHIGTIAIPLVVIDLVDVEWINCVHFIFNNGYCMYRVLIKAQEFIVQFSSRFTYNVFVCACLNKLLGYFQIPLLYVILGTYMD